MVKECGGIELLQKWYDRFNESDMIDSMGVTWLIQREWYDRLDGSDMIDSTGVIWSIQWSDTIDSTGVI